MKRPQIAFFAAIALVLGAMLYSGCQNPSPYLFTPVTNVVAEVVVVRTNFVEVLVTNALPPIVKTQIVNGLPVVQVTPVLTVEHTNELRLVYETNRELRISYQPSTEATGIVRDTGTIVNTFLPGVGTAVTGIGGLVLSIFAHLFTKRRVTRQVEGQMQEVVDEHITKGENAATALAETIENYRDVILSLPNGEAMDAKLMEFARKHQAGLGAADLIQNIVATRINNESAQLVSKAIAAEIAKLKQ